MNNTHNLIRSNPCLGSLNIYRLTIADTYTPHSFHLHIPCFFTLHLRYHFLFKVIFKRCLQNYHFRYFFFLKIFNFLIMINYLIMNAVKKPTWRFEDEENKYFDRSHHTSYYHSNDICNELAKYGCHHR